MIALDRGIGTKQIDSAGLAEEAEGIVVLVGFMITEQGRHRHFEELSNLLQPAAADAVRSFFVFLDLLKRDADVLAELSL
ncbi:hypothetical protein ASF24_06140 [Methylobacterium sp. Leaf86]|nr:hypothetical protein ASF24_06140 [Methylobacterium sp. Leaf86]